MDKLIAVIVLIITVSILVIGELYFKMDRNVATASVLMKKMQNGIEQWIKTSKRIFDNSEISDSLSARYNEQFQKYDTSCKNFREKVLAVNETVLIIKEAIAENVDNGSVIKIGHELTEIYMTFVNICDDYNECSAKLERQINGSIFKFVSTIFSIKPIPKLQSMTVL